jgi:hypothetical protein
MTNFWQGLRSGDWLTPARACGYGLVLLVFGALAMTAGSRRSTFTVLRRAPTDQARIAIGAADIAQA